MGCGKGCCRGLLVFFNIIFWILGAGLIGLSLFFLFSAEISNYLYLLEVRVEDKLTSYALYIMLACGTFMFLAGLVGCCGALRESKCLLGLYIMMVLLAFVSQVSAIALGAVYRSQIDATATAKLSQEIKSVDRVGPRNVFWRALTIGQESIQCCGANGPIDFASSYFQNKGSEFGEHELEYRRTQTVPKSCCRYLEDGRQNFNQCFLDANECSNTNKAMSNVHCDGCVAGLKKKLEYYTFYIIGACAGVALFEVFIILTAACLCRALRSYDDYDDDEDYK